MKNMAKKIKIAHPIALFFLVILLLSCSLGKPYGAITKNIQTDCNAHASYKINNITYRKIDLSLAHYKRCMKYDNLLVVRWNKYNSTVVRTVVNRAMQRYLDMVEMEAKLVQWEQRDDGFYVVYELE